MNTSRQPQDDLVDFQSIQRLVELVEDGAAATEQKKATGPIDAEHSSGRSGQLDQSPFSQRFVSCPRRVA